jgi:hypothetical protein
MQRYENIIYIIIIAALSTVAAFVLPGFFAIEDVSLYLTVTGLIYGLFAAFAIGVSWDRYSKVVENLHDEISSETNMHLLLKHISDRKIALKMDEQILNYLSNIMEIPWNKYFESENVHKKFRKMFDIFGRMELKTEKDSELFDDIGDELESASKARNQQIVLSSTPLSASIWSLLLLLSGAVVVGVYLVAFSSPILGMFTKIIMSLSSFAILLVLHQIDSLQLAEEKVDALPNKAIEIIQKEINR